MLTIQSLFFSYSIEAVLKEVSFSLNAGEVLAITGPNGSGKSTLLKCIAGELPVEPESISLAHEVQIGYMTQGVESPSKTLFEILLTARPELHKIYSNIKKTNQDLSSKGEFLGEFAFLGGYDFEQKCKILISNFGFKEEDLQKPLQRFSEGQKRLLSLLKTLVIDADLYILDEPTNHLDLSTCNSLEELILKEKSKGKAFLIVSHDRVFLDKLADRTLYLKRGKSTLVHGGYSAILEHLEKEFENAHHESEDIKRRIKNLEIEAQRKDTWAAQKEKAKKGAADKGFVSKRASKLAKKAVIARKRNENLIEKLKATKPFIDKKIKLSFPEYSIPKREIVRVENLGHRFEQNELFQQLELVLTNQSRIGLIGPNGSGKTTLMKILVQAMAPSLGKISVNQHAKSIYLSQEIREFFQKETLLDQFKSLPYSEAEIRKYLGCAKLEQEKHLQKVSSLSYGELMRAALVFAIVSKAEFLFLDEPANHLDLESLNILDEILENYKGGMLFISHDRQFLAHHAEEILEIKEGKIKRVYL